MKVTAKCLNADEMEIAMTFTMSLQEWQQVRKALTEATYHWTTSEVNNAIYHMTQKITKTFELDEAELEGSESS